MGHQKQDNKLQTTLLLALIYLCLTSTPSVQAKPTSHSNASHAIPDSPQAHYLLQSPHFESVRLVGGVVSVKAEPITALVCSDLCVSGLGGAVCGSSCLDTFPRELAQFQTDADRERHLTQVYSSSPRSGICPVLCDNGLGQPLCPCSKQISTDFNANWNRVCLEFCAKYGHQLRGCSLCTISSRNIRKMAGGGDVVVFGGNSTDLKERKRKRRPTTKIPEHAVNSPDIDWVEWCRVQCKAGNGGAACNCDLLPFSSG